MKRQYIKPEVKESINGTLEGVFAQAHSNGQGWGFGNGNGVANGNVNGNGGVGNGKGNGHGHGLGNGGSLLPKPPYGGIIGDSSSAGL